MVEKNIMKSRAARGQKREAREFDERVIEVQRVSRVVKGGRRIRFRALVVIGDHKGRVGMGVAKASEVAEAVRKASAQAKKHLVVVPIINGTIPHEIYAKFGSAKVMLKPATPGTTIVAGGSVRVVAELAGISDLLSKIMGSANKINNVSAVIRALSSFNTEIVAKIRKLYGQELVPVTKSLEAEEIKDKLPVIVENKEIAAAKPKVKRKAAAKTEVKEK